VEAYKDIDCIKSGELIDLSTVWALDAGHTGGAVAQIFRWIGFRHSEKSSD
jgi:hypothetical protein